MIFRNYGEHVDEIEIEPSAKILKEGTLEFVSVAGKWRKNESLLDFSSRAAKAALKAGYDVIHFIRQGDVGTAILNEDVVKSRTPYPDEQETIAWIHGNCKFARKILLKDPTHKVCGFLLHRQLPTDTDVPTGLTLPPHA